MPNKRISHSELCITSKKSFLLCLCRLRMLPSQCHRHVHACGRIAPEHMHAGRKLSEKENLCMHDHGYGRPGTSDFACTRPYASGYPRNTRTAGKYSENMVMHVAWPSCQTHGWYSRRFSIGKTVKFRICLFGSDGRMGCNAVCIVGPPLGPSPLENHTTKMSMQKKIGTGVLTLRN